MSHPHTESSTVDCAGFAPALDQDRRIEKWLGYVRLISEKEGRTPERAKLVREIARAMSVSARTVERRVQRYEEFGELGLARRQPSNAGEPRVALSGRADRLISNPEHLEHLVEFRDQLVRSMWASRLGRKGARFIAKLASRDLAAEAVRMGLALSAEDLAIPRHVVERFRKFGAVDTYQSDKKAFSDGAPRIKRDPSDLAPMEVVVVDVKPLDTNLERDDGSTAYPRAMGFLDVGTSRCRYHPILLCPGEGVRKEHINAAFIEMALDPRWGLPQKLYYDHGKENGGLELLRGPLSALARAGHPVIFKSRPYTPQGKPIESVFGAIDGLVQLMDGYTGPDRITKKTETLGKPPKPFGRSFEEFRRQLTGLVDFHNGTANSKGLTPNAIFDRHVAAGWRPNHVDPIDLEVAFRRIVRRKLDRKRLKVDGQFFIHPDLDRTLETVVEVAEPWRRGDPPLFRLDGGKWTRAEPEPSYGFLDKRGIAAGDKRRRAWKGAVRKAARSVDKIDAVETVLRNRPPESPLIPLSRTHKLDPGEAAKDMARALTAPAPEMAQIATREAASADAELTRLSRKLSQFRRLDS